MATVLGSARSRRGACWIALSLLLLGSTVAPPLARAEESRGTDRAASLTYEPIAGYEAPARSPGRLAPAHGSLMGVHSLDSTQIEPEEQGIVKLEQALGRKMDINNHYHGGWDDIAKDGLTWLEKWDVESGRIPLVGWGCYDSNRIISGSEDDVIRATARQMKAFGHEFFMRYCWEMDGSRKQGTVKGPKQFNEAWRHMYRIFQEEGATNVIWTWTANAAGFKDKRKYSNNEPPGPYFYPGDEYVDWIAADGYNWGVSKRNQGDRWRQVLEIFDEFMVFARQHPKPIMIGEYGAQEQKEDPQAKPEWMRLAHDVLINKPKTADCKHCGAYSDVAAVVYFDVDYGSHGDWRIMSSDQTLTAFKEAADDPWFHQMDNVSWPPKLNRTGPNRAAEYGPKRSPDEPSKSTPPPDTSNEEPVPEPEQAPGDDPAAQPTDQQTSQPSDQQTGQPSDQADQAGQPADQTSQPPDQQTGQPPDQTNQSPSDQAGQPPDQQADQSSDQTSPPPDQADQSPPDRADQPPAKQSKEKNGTPPSTQAKQKSDSGRKGKKNR